MKRAYIVARCSTNEKRQTTELMNKYNLQYDIARINDQTAPGYGESYFGCDC